MTKEGHCAQENSNAAFGGGFDAGLTARLAHDHEFTVENGLHLHQCICGETTDADLAENCPICAADPGIQFQRFPWWIVCAVETVLLVIAGVLLILKKKKETN